MIALVIPINIKCLLLLSPPSVAAEAMQQQPQGMCINCASIITIKHFFSSVSLVIHFVNFTLLIETKSSIEMGRISKFRIWIIYCCRRTQAICNRSLFRLCLCLRVCVSVCQCVVDQIPSDNIFIYLFLSLRFSPLNRRHSRRSCRSCRWIWINTIIIL